MANARAQKRAKEVDKSAIVVLCQNKVKTDILTPATADFPWGISNQIQSSGTKHVLNSYVDHDNLYGAKVRSKFICVTEGQGAELSNYKVTDFALVPLLMEGLK